MLEPSPKYHQFPLSQKVQVPHFLIAQARGLHSTQALSMLSPSQAYEF